MPQSPRLLRPSSNFTPRSIPGLALWLDASSADTLYTTDAGPVTAVTAPTDISGCALWLDASDTATITKDGSNLVSQWSDKSGNGRHATASGSNRPTHGSVTQNGRSLLSFDGTATQMQIASTFMVASNVTVFAVAKYNSGSFGAIITSKGTGDTSPALQHSSGAWQINGAGSFSILGSAASHAVLSGVVSALATSAYQNGMLADSDAASGALSSDATVTSIGSYRQAVANILNGTIAEIIVYNTALSTADRARVEAYLATKWGISGVHAPATATSDPVGAWLDKSGNARHATQSTAASRPTISATALNGKKQLGLISQHLRGPSTTWTGSASIYWVGRTGQSANGAFVFGDGTTDQTDGFHAGWLNTAGVGAYGNGWSAGNAPRAESPSAWRNADIVAGVTLSSTEAVARVNGATTNTTAALTGSLSQAVAAQFYIGRESSGTWNNLSGSLAELLIYQPALNASQRLRLERYLAAKYGITLAPQVSNADAQDWINRVYANGGTVSASTASAVNTLCDSLDAASLRDRFYRLNLFCGTGLNAALVPLYQNYRASLGVNQIQGEVFSGWTTVAATILQGAAAAPSAAKAGSPAASSLREDATTGAHRVYVAHTFTGSPCVISAYVKPQGRDWVLLAVEDAGGNPHGLQYFNLAGLAVGSGYSGAANPAITDAGGGWVRISVQFTPTAGSRRIILNTSGGNNNNSTTGDTTKGYDIWGVQLEYGTALTAYDSRPLGNTTDTNVGPFVTGDYNETGASGGLANTGRSKYLNTGFPTSTLTAGDRHLAFYARTFVNADYDIFMGSESAASISHQFALGHQVSASDVRFSFGASTSSIASAGSVSTGAFWLGVHGTSTAGIVYKNGVSDGTGTLTAATPTASEMHIFGINRASLPANVDRYGGTSGGYSVGLGMTASQAAAYYNAMQAFQTALTRNV